jgi:hypothetical protein
MSFGTQRLIGAVTSAFIAAAMVAGAAQARPDDRGGMLGVGSVTAVQDDRPDDRAGPLGVGGVSTPGEQPAAVRPDDRAELRGPGMTPSVRLAYPAVADEGFEWGTPEIGTGVALAMALLASAVLLASRRRERALGY